MNSHVNSPTEHGPSSASTHPELVWNTCWIVYYLFFYELILASSMGCGTACVEQEIVSCNPHPTYFELWLNARSHTALLLLDHQLDHSRCCKGNGKQARTAAEPLSIANSCLVYVELLD